MAKTVDIITRLQHSRGSSAHRFGGPDCYVVAVVRDLHGEPADKHPLSAHNIRKYGWTVIPCGEGYSEHDGPRSMLFRALEKAEKIAEQIESDTLYE